MKIVKNEQALQDLEDIWLHIGCDSPRAADRMMDRIEHSIRVLVDHPEIGPRRDDLRPGLRMLVVRPYLVFYRLGEDRIEIVRVLHGARELGDDV